jgi:Domain of unknown function (DUF4329)
MRSELGLVPKAKSIGLVIASAVLSTSALAQDLPVSSLSSSECYKSPDLAAVAGLDEAEKANSRLEFAGAIVEKNGNFCYTSPVSNRDDGSFKVRLQFPKDYRLVALFHTHPDHPNSEFFSKADVDVATSTRLVSYIRVVAREETLRFDPKVDRLEKYSYCVGSPGELVRNTVLNH